MADDECSGNFHGPSCNGPLFREMQTHGARGVRKMLGLATENIIGYDGRFNCLGIAKDTQTGAIYCDENGWLHISSDAYVDDVLAVMHSLMVGYKHPKSDVQTKQVRLAAQGLQTVIKIMDARHFMDGGHRYSNSEKERAVNFE